MIKITAHFFFVRLGIKIYFHEFANTFHMTVELKIGLYDIQSLP